MKIHCTGIQYTEIQRKFAMRGSRIAQFCWSVQKFTTVQYLTAALQTIGTAFIEIYGRLHCKNKPLRRHFDWTARQHAFTVRYHNHFFRRG